MHLVLDSIQYVKAQIPIFIIIIYKCLISAFTKCIYLQDLKRLFQIKSTLKVVFLLKLYYQVLFSQLAATTQEHNMNALFLIIQAPQNRLIC